MKSEPHADSPQFAVTGVPPGPVPVHSQGTSLPASLLSLQDWPVHDQPAALQEYVVKSDPHADWPQYAVTGTPPGPVPLQEHVQDWPVHDQPVALQEYVVKSDPHADWPQSTVTGYPPGPLPEHWQMPASPLLHAWPVYVQPAASQE